MGTILSSRILSGNMIKLKLSLDEEEALSLKGCVKNINVFSSDLCNEESSVIETGKKGVTKYFKIPSSLRNRKKKRVFEIKCQKIESSTKIIFIYSVNHNKNQLF